MIIIGEMKHLKSLYNVQTGNLKLSKSVRDKLSERCLENSLLFDETKNINKYYSKAKEVDHYVIDQGIGIY